MMTMTKAVTCLAACLHVLLLLMSVPQSNAFAPPSKTFAALTEGRKGVSIASSTPQLRPSSPPKQYRAALDDSNKNDSQRSSIAITTKSSSEQDINDNTPNTQQSPSSSIFPTNPASHYDALICGGGPAGLLAAIMLSQKFGPSYKIAVCEQRAAIPLSPTDPVAWNDVARFYLLGIGHRGQAALRHFGVYDDFVKASVQVNGRRDWQPGTTRVDEGRITPAQKDPPSRVLARDKLVGVLHEHLVKNYIQANGANIDLLYGYQVEPTSFGNDDANNEDIVTVRITKCQDIQNNSSSSYKASQDSEQVCNVDDYVITTTNFLIGADGAARTVARAMQQADTDRFQQLKPWQRLFSQKPFRIVEFPDDNPRVYKSVPIQLPADWPRDLNYSARSRNNSRVTLEGLPSNGKGNLCALLLMRPDDELAQPNVDPAILRQFFDEEFPQFGALIDDNEMTRIAQKPASRLPVFRYTGPRLHVGRRTLVLGDAAHVVKPYYGLGANTALEDVQVLSDRLDQAAAASTTTTTTSAAYIINSTDFIIPQAVQAFSNRRAGDAEALVTISRNMDRPGRLFFVYFLVPLILDGIFHKMAPRIFGPNMFGMFQKKGVGFKQIQRKKRLDRALQLVCITTLLSTIGVGIRTSVRWIDQATGQSQVVVSLSVLLTGMVAAVIQKPIKQKRVVKKNAS